MDNLTQEHLTVWACGCYYETSLDITGEVVLIRAKTCTACFDNFLTKLDDITLEKSNQLTLDLASQREQASR